MNITVGYGSINVYLQTLGSKKKKVQTFLKPYIVKQIQQIEDHLIEFKNLLKRFWQLNNLIQFQ